MSQTSVRISTLTLSILLSGITPSPAQEGQSSNPIGRVARLFNPELVEVEERIDWLSGRLSALATYQQRPLRSAVGWRGGRVDPDGGEPSIVLDLGETFPLSDVYLIPAQPQPGDTERLFPLQYRLETSREPDFSESQVLFDARGQNHSVRSGYPIRFNARDTDARYVRFTVQKGHFRGIHDIAALAELVVVSGGQPVSFGAEVTATQSMDVPGSWSADFINDGRSPLGVWEGGQWEKSEGEYIEVSATSQTVEWILDMGEEEAVDQVILFPFRLPELVGPGVLPAELQVSLSATPDFDPANATELIEGGESSTPLLIRPPSGEARFLVIRSEKALQLGPKYLQSMAEIEVWAKGRNLAAGEPITVRHQGLDRTSYPELTDGRTNGLQIFPVGQWLRQLTERAQVAGERDSLAQTRIGLATQSEINATWGASIIIGLTFLIPVAIVERRRLISRKSLDKLRKRIASDLHDDIGSNLGSISLIARAAKRDLQRLHGPDAIAEDLGEVELIARESSLAMRDIVWLLERRDDSIGDFVKRMRDTAGRLLREIDYDLICRSNRTAAKMTLEAKRHLFLFYKEALHNILKHSGADRVDIKIYDQRDRLIMEVRDNGKGLPVGKNERPKAVRKLTDRAKVLDGTLQIESSPGEGTLLRLAVKRANLLANKAAA